jgi:hypothetical protein
MKDSNDSGIGSEMDSWEGDDDNNAAEPDQANGNQDPELDWQDRVQQLFLDKEHERLGPRTSPKRL